MAKKIQVLIPNATGPTNVGDQAILYSLLRLLRECSNNLEITVLTSDPDLCKEKKGLKFDASLYEWSMASSLSFYAKLSRSIRVFTGLLFLKLKIGFLIGDGELLKIINYYKKADLILYVGGGSLRTTKGIKDGYILLIILTIYSYANLYKTRKIITPLSFGPFSNSWQYHIAAKILEKSDIVSFREIYSCIAFKKKSTKKFLKSTDFALFLSNEKVAKGKDFVIGFTIRNWLKKKDQDSLEKSYARALYDLSREYKIKIQPIIQVNRPDIKNHDDLKATRGVLSNLRQLEVETREEIIIRNLSSAIKTYGGINLLIGMRMHSNIIAATQGVPFLAISYEHKTEGIAFDLGVSDYCLKAERVNSANLSGLLNKAYKNHLVLSQTITASINRMRAVESQKWQKIFRSYLQ